jgi:predicted Fe-Mo cluster-binding NifX family protein
MNGLLLALALAAPALAAEPAAPVASIAVAAKGAEEQAEIAGKVEEASQFLLFTNEGTFLRSVAANPAGGMSGAAEQLAKEGVSILVSGSFDPKAQEVLNSNDIIPIEKQGKAGETVKFMQQCEAVPPAGENVIVIPPEK